ncbi:unnamed protein product [Sphenostylis stenocarpa]|uniref:Uncharacterized protein n=1 Tax=Sphenostylis stenocarpa TaxID=92480 RepID=A0AA86SWP1_9FABA|nr:unnamed protein product [Sphenostylis stenocarpa]
MAKKKKKKRGGTCRPGTIKGKRHDAESIPIRRPYLPVKSGTQTSNGQKGSPTVLPSNGQRYVSCVSLRFNQMVHVDVAGGDNIPVPETSI